MFAPPNTDDALLGFPHKVPVLITAHCIAEVRDLALRVHEADGHADAPFVEVSAKVLPSHATDLATSWLNFSSSARGGSILLTEVEAVPPALQDTLARLVSYSRARQVRVISGTTERLIDLVQTGRFSETLLYRLNVVHLRADDLTHG